MAEAVKELYPDNRRLLRPGDGNRVLLRFRPAEPFTPDDLEKDRSADARHRGAATRRSPGVRERDAAVAFFRDLGESYKLNISGEIRRGRRSASTGKAILSICCVGPHLPSTGCLGQAFKLPTLAGAYWRGDPKNAQLQRVYGTAGPARRSSTSYFSSRRGSSAVIIAGSGASSTSSI